MNDQRTASFEERRRLAAALADWGHSAQLADALADDIFAAIVATPATVWSTDPEDAREAEPDIPLGPTWWRRHSADLAATMVRSTRWVPAA